MKMSTRLIALAAALKNAPVSFNTGDLVVHHDLFKANRNDDTLLVVLDNTRQSTSPGYGPRSSFERVENTTPSVIVGFYNPHGNEHETRQLPNYMLRLATHEEIDSLDQRACALALDILGDRRNVYSNAGWLTEKPPVPATTAPEEVLTNKTVEAFDIRAEYMLDNMDIEVFTKMVSYPTWLTKKARKICKSVRKEIKAGRRVHDGNVPEVIRFPDDAHTVLVYSRGVMPDGAVVEDLMVHQPGNQSWFNTEQFVQLSVAKYCIHEDWEIAHFMTSIDQ
jgi:hypothetical protein